MAALQRFCRDQFRNLDALVCSPSVSKSAAMRARKAITSSAVIHLQRDPKFGSSGIYLWANSDHEETDGKLVYVGIAKFDSSAQSGTRRGQTIEVRLSDYFLKEYTVLDGEISIDDEETARSRILARLMLLHKPERAEEYTRRHLKSYRMSRASKIYYSDASTFAPLLEDIEAALIVSGNAIQPKNPLVNVSKVNMRPGQIGADAWIAAELAVASWRSAGLDSSIAKTWINKIKEMATY